MAQSGYTPIALYHSITPGATPAAGDLVDGELALNIADGYLFFKQSGVVQNLAGLSGYSGVSGFSGISGFSGQSGFSGFSGISGFSGRSGFSGTNGVSGFSGAVGASGASGASGFSGLSGFSGASGLSGFSGASGISGFSGAQGPTIYPAAGVPVSTGSSWNSSLTAPSGNLVGTTDTQTLTNKTITARVSSAASISSPLAWNSDNFDQYAATAQANDLTISADAGTPTNGRKIIFRFKDDGTPRALTWTTGSSKSFRAVGVVLPTTTVANKTLYVGCIYNLADDRWDMVAVASEV